MEQRDFSPWSQLGHSRPRLLIEDPDRALRVADFSLFTEAGLDVALCSGPDDGDPCPLVDHGECRLADTADVVLMGPGMIGHRHAVADALHRAHPDLPVVVEVPRGGPCLTPDGCIPLAVPSSIAGQIRAVWRALDPAEERPPAAEPAVRPVTSPHWPDDPSAPAQRPRPGAPGHWPADPDGPRRSSAPTAWEARLADLLGW